MKITINCNDDTITVEDLEPRKVRDPNQLIKILQNVFDKLDDSRLASTTPYFDIELEKIDEDFRTTVGEW